MKKIKAYVALLTVCLFIVPATFGESVQITGKESSDGISVHTASQDNIEQLDFIDEESEQILSENQRIPPKFENQVTRHSNNDTKKLELIPGYGPSHLGIPNNQGDIFSSAERLIISLSIMLILLLLVTSAGNRIGISYIYETGDRTRKWIGVGQLVSAFLIAIPIFVIITMQTIEGVDDYFFSMLYAVLGLQVYLFFSSLIQAVSLFRRKPLPPMYYIHILFVFITISLILMAKIPFFPPLPNTILAISIVFFPGAVLALLTAQITRRIHYQTFDSSITFTHPKSRITNEITSSFPDSLLPRYRDVKVIGSGGVAIVYRAVRIRDGQEVALKIPFSPDETSGKTFLNEMAIWRNLHHPGIVEVYDQNIFPVPYVEMEYISRSLRDLTYPVAPGLCVSIIRDIANALLYAHSMGIIHRDIKPGNVLITHEGKAKLTDWGLSRSLSRDNDTKNTSFSLYYATPEQLAPDMYGNGDQRTDIYQLGVLLFELLCGEPPYVKAGIGEIFMAIQKNQYQLPSTYDMSFTHFDKIIKKSLQVNPSQRFTNIEEFIHCLDAV